MGYLHSENYYHLSTFGKIADRAHHFVLPGLCYVMGSFAEMSFLSRNSMLEELSKDYIRTAKAKGLTNRIVHYRHALRNALLPLVTGIGGLLGLFFSGSILIETIFRLDGIGRLAFQSVLARDYNIVMALTLMQSFVMLIGNLVSDIVYIFVDPRIDYD